MGTSHTSDPLSAALSRLRSAADPLSALDAARELRQLAEAAELEHVQAARDAGTPWSKIGKVYGLTKQGAQQRFRPSRDDAARSRD